MTTPAGKTAAQRISRRKQKFNIWVSVLRALVDWTGRSLAKGRRGALPAELRPILEDLDVEVERWVGTVRDYGGMFHRVAGKVSSLERKAEALGQRWLAGVRASREVFRTGGAPA